MIRNIIDPFVLSFLVVLTVNQAAHGRRQCAVSMPWCAKVSSLIRKQKKSALKRLRRQPA